MVIYLSDGQAIDGGNLITAILRYDLVPVPVTLELTVNATKALRAQLVVGKTLHLVNGVMFEIVKAHAVNNNAVKDGRRLGGIAVIAVLAGCVPLLSATKRATIHDDISIAQAYQSLGARLRFSEDIKLRQFVCLKGQMPTIRLALALQKEAAVMVYDADNKTANARRIQTLMSQTPIRKYDPAQIQWVENPTQVARQNTNFLSVADDGKQIVGQTLEGKRVDYMPRTDQRELGNLKRILITHGVLLRSMDDELQAGKTVQVGNEVYALLTVAHRFDTGALGGASVGATKAWLAQVADA